MDLVIKEDKIYKDLVRCLLEKIYYSKLHGLDDSYKLVVNKKNKVYITNVLSQFLNNIQIFIIKIHFLKTILKPNKHIMYNTFYTFCVECGKVHAQHKYKSCGHYVNRECALYKTLNTNKCRCCEKKIINRKLQIVKKKKKDICSICLDETRYALKGCGHHFHKKCIKKFMQWEINVLCVEKIYLNWN